jgi:MFS family permease
LRFRRFIIGWLFSNLAAQMLTVAVGWSVYASSHSALDLGWVGLARFVPAFGMSLLAGDAADRFHRGRLVAMANGTLCGCAIALALGANVFAVLVAVSAAQAFAGPAEQAMVPGLVSPGSLQRALAATSAVWQLATVGGPALGGAAYALTGAQGVFDACAVLFALAALLNLGLGERPAPAGDEPVWRRVRMGLDFVRARPVMLQAISLDLFAVLLGGATALLPVFASDVLHVGPWGLGLLRSAPAAGAALTALVLGARPLGRRAGPTLLACVAVFGAATVVFGLSRSLPLSLAALVTLGGADMVSVVVRSTVIQLATPDALRGRVSAVTQMFIVASSDLGELESGVAAALLGTAPSVLLGGLGTLAVVAVYALCASALRAVDRLDVVGARR